MEGDDGRRQNEAERWKNLSCLSINACVSESEGERVLGRRRMWKRKFFHDERIFGKERERRER